MNNPRRLPEGSASSTPPEVVTGQDETPKPSRLKRALVVSVIIHALLLLVLLFWYLPTRKAKRDAETTATKSAAKVDTRPSKSPAAPPPELMTPKPADDVPAEQIEKSIQSQMKASESLPPEAQLSELEKNLSRLKSIANEKSVEQVTQKIGSSLGLDTQAYQPKADVPEGSFDFDTAQLSDVERKTGDDGQYVYEAVMIDSAGRKSTVEMPADQGKTMYDLFGKMKKYPMAAGIYRSVVMPMLQKIIEAEKAAKKAAREARRIQAEEDSR